jgi:hypothetical protein
LELIRCNVCRTFKELKEFYCDKYKKNGHKGHCKVCARHCKRSTSALSVRIRVYKAIRQLADLYDVSMSQVVEMCVLDAMQDEGLATTDWGGRLTPAVQIHRRKLHPVTGEPVKTKVKKVGGRVYVSKADGSKG